MGTRSLTRVHVGDEKSSTVASIYRQMDGYFEGMGTDLKEFLDQYKIINGIGMDDGSKKRANGMQCLAAQLIAHFKDDAGVGGIYMTTPDDEQEYNYDIYLEQTGKGLKLRLKGVGDYDNKVKKFTLKTEVATGVFC